MLEGLRDAHQCVVTLEDGVLDGGFGEKIARYYGPSSMRVLCFGAEKAFVNHVSVGKQYERNHLTAERVVNDLLNQMN